ncbi:serine/threonine-protein kinase [Sorangium sp. So ce1389]|uniref:serine/threonine-protein kinase n=1 Tax=Sorangium sp. So ce1389 TaxID=3133336 RepID=UPI003F648AD2
MVFLVCLTNNLVPGALVASRYRVDRQLAEGGMGVIWAATRLASGERVALKMLRPGATEDASIRRRLLREARAAAAVDHPNVPCIHDVLELDDGTPFLVMDLLEGESLRDKLLREAQVPLPELSRILLPVISAVGTAHALGIVHRDLKPDNIFLLTPEAATARSSTAPGSGPRAALIHERGAAAPDAPDDEGSRVRVLDFGIAKLTARHGQTAWTSGRTGTGEMLGTPYYMSPEQILGEHDVDHRADIWSLGVILYECLTSIRPTEAENMGKVLKRILTGAIQPIGEIAPALPADVAAMIDRMLCPDRAQRPADLQEVGALLGPYAGVALRPFGPPAAPGEPEGDAPAVEARTGDALSAGAADLDGEASLATLRAGSLLPAPPSSTPLPAHLARAAALEALEPAAAPTSASEPAAAAATSAPAPAAAALAGAAAVAPGARGARSAGVKLIAAALLVAAGAGLSLLHCSTSSAHEAPRIFIVAPGAKAPGDTVAPAANAPGGADAPANSAVRKSTQGEPEMP